MRNLFGGFMLAFRIIEDQHRQRPSKILLDDGATIDQTRRPPSNASWTIVCFGSVCLELWSTASAGCKKGISSGGIFVSGHINVM